MAIQDCLQDLRYNIAQFRRTPYSIGLLLVMLGLGVGATTATFSALYTLVLDPLPVREPHQIIVFNAPAPRGGDALKYWSQLQALENLCSYRFGGLNITAGSMPRRKSVAIVSATFFPVFEVIPQKGRQFVAEDENPGQTRIAIISDRLWLENYARDESVIGAKLEFEGNAFEIIGVMPRGFAFPGETDIWIPLSQQTNLFPLGDDEQLGVQGLLRSAMAGRLRDSTTIEQVNAEAEILFERLKETGVNPGDRGRMFTLRELAVKDYKIAFLALLGSAISLLLIGVANGANIQLVRGSLRQKEIAMRVCLGATRWQVLRLFLIEGSLIAIVSGLFGIGIAYLSVTLTRISGQAFIRQLSDLRVNGKVLGFALFVALVASLLVEVAPLLQVVWKNPVERLRDGGNRVGARPRRRVANVIAVVQVSLAIVLIVGAALMIQTLFRVTAVDSGFDPQNVISMKIELSPSRYVGQLPSVSEVKSPSQRRTGAATEPTSKPGGTSANKAPIPYLAAAEFQRGIVDRISRLDGVISAACASQLPLSGSPGSSLSVKVASAEPKIVLANNISGDYFHCMGIPVLRGRAFIEEDGLGSNKVVIVNDAFAQLYWPGVDPLGKQLTLEGESSAREVVGVVGSVKHRNLIGALDPQFYLSYLQPYNDRFGVLRRMVVLLRTKSEVKALIPSVRSVIATLDDRVAVFSIRTMDEVISDSVSAYRFRASVLGAFSSFALIFAACGVFGLLAYVVTAQIQEIGTRMALGASPQQIWRMILFKGLRLSVIGIVIGSLAAVGLGRLIANLLYGIQPLDTVTLLASAAVLTLSTTLACLIPAFIASRVDPARVLRYQ